MKPEYDAHALYMKEYTFYESLYRKKNPAHLNQKIINLYSNFYYFPFKIHLLKDLTLLWFSLIDQDFARFRETPNGRPMTFGMNKS